MPLDIDAVLGELKSLDGLKAFANLIPQILYFADPDGHALFYNSYWLSYTGLMPTDPWSRAVHPDDLADVERAWASAQASAGVFETEYRIKNQSGQYRWHKGRSVPIREGTLIKGWIGIASDIEAQKQAEGRAEAERQRLHSLFMQAPVPIAIVRGPDHTYELSNPLNNLYVGSGNIVGKPVREALPELGPVVAGFLDQARNSGERVCLNEIDVTFSPDGAPKRCILNVIYQPFRDAAGHVEGVMATGADVTELVLARQRLEEQAQLLLHSNQELERFAYVASHDLKEPLRMIVSHLQLLLRKFETHWDDEARSYVAFAVDSAKRLYSLIDDLLAYSRAGRHKQEFVEVEVPSLLNTVIQDLQLQIEEAGAVITVRELPKVWAIPTLLSQLFSNLITNALKYRSGAHLPQIEIGCIDEPAHYRFFVKDNGIGIAPAYHERIFEIFQRLHSKSSYSGNGIGLSICKRIALNQGGKIWVESEEGRGATFFFTLPKKRLA